MIRTCSDLPDCGIDLSRRMALRSKVLRTSRCPPTISCGRFTIREGILTGCQRSCARRITGAWLHGSIDEARAALQPYPPDHMYAFEVSTRVNSSKNNGPELIEPAKANVG